MITNSKQKWSLGATVKVGFLSLTVLAAVATPGDYAPDAYLLGRTDAKGQQKLYRFVPHNGLTGIDTNEANAMIADMKSQVAA